ncbi:MAG: hypothetical protein KGJ90_01790 [Patescibacteria group bacterium]|nr:hypothetical protein [Patescibacteria group bacterium]
MSGVIDLEKGKASRTRVESYLEKQKPELVIMNGHGSEDCITGQDEEVLIQAGENSDLLKDKVVYMRSCDSGKVLGPQAVREGCKAFIGYSELFRFWTNENFVRKPLDDNYARPFFETSNQVALALVKGKSAREAHEESRKAYEKIVSRLLTSDAENSFVVPDLYWNFHHQVCLER